MPNPERQAQCVELALKTLDFQLQTSILSARMPRELPAADSQECIALHMLFADSPSTHFNNTKSFIGHAMGAAGPWNWRGNLPSFQDKVVHATINLDNLDPDCALRGLVSNQPRRSIE
ncbi:MAG: hypothetical protein R3C56_28980 [Pirellulaceae bacterium]